MSALGFYDPTPNFTMKLIGNNLIATEGVPVDRQNTERIADSMAQLGDGGFLSSDFELLQQVGRLSVQQVGSRRMAPDWNPSAEPLMPCWTGERLCVQWRGRLSEQGGRVAT